MTNNQQGREAAADARERQRARDASGEVHIEGSIYEGMEAALTRHGRTIAHVARYADAIEIADAIRFTHTPGPASSGAAEAKYADMGTHERAVAMADDCAGDPWELLGYFREKLRQSDWEADHARSAALELAQKLAAIRALPTPEQPAQASEVERLREALEDVVNPIRYLQRMADAEGAKLGGMAYAIANDIATVQRIARAALDQPSTEKGA